MLDIKFIRENKDLVKMAAQKKRLDFDVDKLLAVDDKRVTILGEVEKMRAEQNSFNDKISGSDEATRAGLIAQMKVLKDGLQKKEEDLKNVMGEWKALMLGVPNIPDISVPDGASDEDNKETKTFGEKPKFDFKPKSHIELMQDLGLVDFERGSKVSGFRGYFLKGVAVKLSMAIWQYVMDKLESDGFTPMMTPALVRPFSLMGTGYLPQGADDLYKTQDEEYLSGTAEVPLMSYYADEVLEKNKLPIKLAGFSPCYRREAGAHGKDTKGLIRVHEFYKVEQLILCEASHEESVKWHEQLTENAEKLVQSLELPYRVVINCGGDLGLGQVKKYDIEVFMPGENKYRETHSASYFHDFQTRRLGIKYKDTDGKLKFCHSLNNTAIATPRILAAIVENYQQADGSIAIPKILQKYIGYDAIKKRNT